MDLCRVPRIRPKSVPSADVLSSGSSDSGLESDLLSMLSLNGSKVDIDTEKVFKFGPDVADEDRMRNLQSALTWVRNELKTMKSQDKLLARTMIDIRSKIQQVKIELESLKDTGYDSDEIEAVENKQTRILNSEHDLSSINNDFPVNSSNFEKNKRATWAV